MPLCVFVLRLPSCRPEQFSHRLQGVGELVASVADRLGSKATLVVLGEVIDLVAVHAAMPLRYQHWIAIKRTAPRQVAGNATLPQYHFGALIYTRYNAPLRHTKTRIQYTYCPACGKTTKDYGGKKHTYHEYGTLMSDVWRDVACDLDGDLTAVFERLADLFGLRPYKNLTVVDCRPLNMARIPATPVIKATETSNRLLETNTLICGDAIEQLQKIPDNSVDFVFTDPPYNLGKKYTGYSDDLEITRYFNWCDEWLTELARVLKPGRTLALLNIPLWAIRHFLHLEAILDFQAWIAWDALSYPVRKIMPAHYAILCFSKGDSRPLPGLNGEAGKTNPGYAPLTFDALNPLAEGFCLRATCVRNRMRRGADDRGPLTDLWWDIHRLKHNSRRVDHPTQLPPQLLYRLIGIFTKPGEVVLDCFNGSGTTTLAAHQLRRHYIGIELEGRYHRMALGRHQEIEAGLDPFRKAERRLSAKNSPVPRMPKQKYEVPKKTLQLEVKRVAEWLGHLPSREELIEHGRYPIRYYDEYFVSWGEVCAAARTTGMSEEPPVDDTTESSIHQSKLF